MAVPVLHLASSSSLLFPLVLLQLLVLASACDRCVHHSKAAYYTSSLTLTGTNNMFCFCLSG
jgi:hypothetical protein